MARSARLTSVAATGRTWGGHSLYLSRVLMFQVTPDIFITSESVTTVFAGNIYFGSQFVRSQSITEGRQWGCLHHMVEACVAILSWCPVII